MSAKRGPFCVTSSICMDIESQFLEFESQGIDGDDFSGFGNIIIGKARNKRSDSFANETMSFRENRAWERPIEQ